MGTRGLFGFRKNGYDKAAYRHFDSYPDGLGQEFLMFVKVNGPEKLNSFFDNIEEIDTNTEPTQEQKNYCKEMGWIDLRVSDQTDDDWYCLLRYTQDINDWQICVDKNQKMYLDNFIHFIQDSLFCEYAYIFDLDTNELEFYIGFQKLPQVGNRYGITPKKKYYPCRLALKIPFDEINIKENVAEMNRIYESD